MALTKVIGRGLGVQGDTVAGDDAALGFTSAEGLILTGQGTTGDVTIKNDADALVAFVPTGTDDLRIPDDAQLQFGNDADLKIYHGSNNTTYFEGGTNSGKMRFYTAGNLALDIDTNGIISQYKQPAFLAHPSSTQSNIAVGSDITVLFATEIFDQNADFNTANYTFTAPVTGRYQFNIVYYLESIDTDTGYYYIFFDTSNRNYFNIISPKFTADTSYLSLTLSMLVDMDASDTALCKIRQSHGTSQTDISGNSYFSGYLVA